MKSRPEHFAYELSHEPVFPMIFRIAAASFCLAVFVFSARSAEPAPEAISAKDLAARLSAWQQDGASYVRLRMEVNQPPGTKERASNPDQGPPNENGH